MQARPESIDGGIAYIRDEVMPVVQGMDGCIGHSMLVDRESGRCIVTVAWESLETMRASAEQVRPLRERAVQSLGAGAPEIQEWEIAIMHRTHPSHEGACVRATWVKGDPANVDRLLDVYKLVTIPGLEQLEGFCSASLLIDRSTGRAVSSVTFDSRRAMEANRDQAASVRAASTQEARFEILDVCEFDLALAHLHVPEMA